MKHPRNRSERRHNGEVWRNRQRRKMIVWWREYRSGSSWFKPEDNNMWWGRKQTSAHGNRCACHYEKFSRKEVRKRRQGLDVKAGRKSVSLLSLRQGFEASQYEGLD
jgi:hypothetical protein